MARYIACVLIAPWFAALPAASGLDIIWVSEGRSPASAQAYSLDQGLGWVVDNPTDATPYDQGWIDLLLADGHTVDYRTNSTTGDPVADWQNNGFWQGTLSQGQKDDLNAADLVIISPDFNGTQYNPAGVGRLDWNAIATPLMSLTPQPLAQEVWRWSESSASNLREMSLLDNDATPANSQPPYQRTLIGPNVPGGNTLRSTNDTVQFDLIDEMAPGGSQMFAYTRAKWDSYRDDDGSTLDWSRLEATTGELISDGNPWRAPSPDAGRNYLIWDLRWDAGQTWCATCDPADSPAPQAARQMFLGAFNENPAALRDPSNPGLGTHYVGAGVESFTPTGEAMFLDKVELLAAPDLAALQKKRPAPLYTPTIDGTVTPAEMAAQLRVPMTVATEGVPREAQMRGGTILESSNSQNGVVPNGQSGTCDGCGFDPAELSGDWYVSWDADSLYVSAVVKDDSPFFAISRDLSYLFSGTTLPHDAVGFVFNPNNDAEGGGKARYEATVGSDQPGLGQPPALGPSINRNGGATPFATLQQDGVVIEGEQTVDDQEAFDGYVLEMEIPWEVAMQGAGGDSYVPTPGDEHGLSFMLGGWSDFLGGGANDAANNRSLFIDFAHGETQTDKSPTDLGIDIFDSTLWNAIVLVAFGADFNSDGAVDGLDLAIWEEGFSIAGDAAPSDGDANNDLSVDGRDFLIWQREVTPVASAAEATPEPTAPMLALLAALAALSIRSPRQA